MKRWLKAELHTHTREDPLDGERIVFYRPQEMIELAAEKGFEVLAITNHKEMLFNKELAEYAGRLGVVLIPGVEANLVGKHVLLYNFPNYQSSWRDPEIVRYHKNSQQLVIAPHPFFPTASSLRRRFFEWLDLFDALEYSHFYLRRMNFNRRAEEIAARLQLPLVGNSDLHRLDQLGRTFSLIYAEKDAGSVIQAVKEGNVRVVTQPETTTFFVSWLAASTTGRSRYAIRDFFSSSLR